MRRSRLTDSGLADISGLTEPAAESALRSTDLTAFSEALLSLGDDDDGKVAMANAARAIERVRRSCPRLLDRANAHVAKTGESTLNVSIRQWLTAGVELVEDLLQTSSMASSGLPI